MSFRVLFLLTLGVLPAATRAQATTPVGTNAVHGVVHDSLTGRPLGNAMVQLVAPDDPAGFSRTAFSDSLGRYALDSVPAGRWVLGFAHPMLDSLGLPMPLWEVDVVAGKAARADLAIPGPGRLRAAICGAGSGDSTAILLGFVRDATTQAGVPGASVFGRWLELSLTKGGLASEPRAFTATTREDGWFAVCGVPRDIVVGLAATRGDDSTAVIEAQVPGTGFLRHDLYLGASEEMIEVAIDSSGAPADSAGVATRRVLVGTGRLTGTVKRAADGGPMADAHVAIIDGPDARTNARGEWTLGAVPTGTRILEVRALGHYPERRVVHVTADVPPLHLSLSTFKAVMDTIKVVSTRLYDRDRSGFERRRVMGAGYGFDSERIARLRPSYTSELLRMVPGIRMRPSTRGTGYDITMARGTFSGDCVPSIYVDGVLVARAQSTDLDSWVRPEDVESFEVYNVSSAPAQYQTLNGCGVVLIWLK